MNFPPAEFPIIFTPGARTSNNRPLIDFSTTDGTSGIDHYEVGIIDKNQPLTESPVFVEAESPFQVPLVEGGKLEVIIRAVDKAGNVRDESIDVRQSFGFAKFFKNYPIYILIALIFFGLFMFFFHSLVGRHFIQHIRDIIKASKKENPPPPPTPPAPPASSLPVEQKLELK